MPALLGDLVHGADDVHQSHQPAVAALADFDEFLVMLLANNRREQGLFGGVMPLSYPRR